jgi:hypothetical protein
MSKTDRKYNDQKDKQFIVRKLPVFGIERALPVLALNGIGVSPYFAFCVVFCGPLFVLLVIVARHESNHNQYSIKTTEQTAIAPFNFFGSLYLYL